MKFQWCCLELPVRKISQGNTVNLMSLKPASFRCSKSKLNFGIGGGGRTGGWGLKILLFVSTFIMGYLETNHVTVLC